MIIAATTPIAAGIKIWRLLCRIVTWSVWLVRGPPYSGEEKMSAYDPTVEGARNVSVTVRLSPGGMVTPVFVPTGCGLPWMKRFTVMTSVILVELFVRWSVAVMLKRPACGLCGTTGLVPGVIGLVSELGEVLRFAKVT